MRITVVSFAWAAILVCPLARSQSTYRPAIPKTWDKASLADWVTPVAGLNVRPTHISSQQYYSLEVDNLRTYPVFAAGKEPQGYWEMLQHVGPKPLIEPEKLESEADWIEAGRIVFEESDHIHLRTLDPKFVNAARSGEPVIAGTNGIATNLRWVPTKDGVALSFPNCANCHVLVMPDGTRIPGASSFAIAASGTRPTGPPLVNQVHLAKHFVIAAAPIRMGSEPLGMWLYRAFGVPWKTGAINAKLKTVSMPEYQALIAAGVRGGALPRRNGSPLYPAKVPDLIGISKRKYIDATGAHLNRGIGDLMRYAALDKFRGDKRFGPYNMLGPDSIRPQARRSDEALYALALYIQSLQPPPNPNPVDEKSTAGEKIFRREGCIGCHVPPLYTSNKLTLAQGFTPPRDTPTTLDILRVSVGTDRGLALDTRKGTGYYKVPSLKGVWYRGHYLHDGSAASLEEMFDPDRINDSHTPGGYNPPGIAHRAIKGHEFGLRLNPVEQTQLISFLRTL